MILATHVVIAAAVTKPLAGLHPIIPFAAGLASHYFADAIPHWHYPIRMSAEKDNPLEKTWHGDRRAFTSDFLRFALDGLAGAAIAFLVVWPSTLAEFLWLASAAAGSVLPDALQGVYLGGARFLKPHQIFHYRAHAKIKLDAYPLIGIPFQLAIAIVAILFLI